MYKCVCVCCRYEDGVWIIGRQRAVLYWSIGILALCLTDFFAVCHAERRRERTDQKPKHELFQMWRCETSGRSRRQDDAVCKLKTTSNNNMRTGAKSTETKKINQDMSIKFDPELSHFSMLPTIIIKLQLQSNSCATGSNKFGLLKI